MELRSSAARLTAVALSLALSGGSPSAAFAAYRGKAAFVSGKTSLPAALAPAGLGALPAAVPSLEAALAAPVGSMPSLAAPLPAAAIPSLESAIPARAVMAAQPSAAPAGLSSGRGGALVELREITARTARGVPGVAAQAFDGQRIFSRSGSENAPVPAAGEALPSNFSYFFPIDLKKKGGIFSLEGQLNKTFSATIRVTEPKRAGKAFAVVSTKHFLKDPMPERPMEPEELNDLRDSLKRYLSQSGANLGPGRRARYDGLIAAITQRIQDTLKPVPLASAGLPVDGVTPEGPSLNDRRFQKAAAVGTVLSSKGIPFESVQIDPEWIGNGEAELITVRLPQGVPAQRVFDALPEIERDFNWLGGASWEVSTHGESTSYRNMLPPEFRIVPEAEAVPLITRFPAGTLISVFQRQTFGGLPALYAKTETPVDMVGFMLGSGTAWFHDRQLKPRPAGAEPVAFDYFVVQDRSFDPAAPPAPPAKPGADAERRTRLNQVRGVLAQMKIRGAKVEIRPEGRGAPEVLSIALAEGSPYKQIGEVHQALHKARTLKWIRGVALEIGNGWGVFRTVLPPGVALPTEMAKTLLGKMAGQEITVYSKAEDLKPFSGSIQVFTPSVPDKRILDLKGAHWILYARGDSVGPFRGNVTAKDFFMVWDGRAPSEDLLPQPVVTAISKAPRDFTRVQPVDISRNSQGKIVLNGEFSKNDSIRIEYVPAAWKKAAKMTAFLYRSKSPIGPAVEVTEEQRAALWLVLRQALRGGANGKDAKAYKALQDAIESMAGPGKFQTLGS